MDYPFHSDGCSTPLRLLIGRLADLDMATCCLFHDFEYWCAVPSSFGEWLGFGWERRAADERFRKCIRRFSERYGWTAAHRWFGTRIGGASWVPAPTFRWGYGWKYSRLWHPPTPDDYGPYTFQSERPKLIGHAEECLIRQGYRMIGEYWAKPHVQPNDVVIIPLPLELGWLVFERVK